MKLTKKLIALILVLALSLSCGACKEPEGKGGGFIYCLSGPVRSIDPQTAQGKDAHTIIKALFSGLCRLDAEGNAVPGVADSWEAAGTQYTFHLDKKAKWSNGDPVTAHDFVFAIRRALDPNTKAEDVDELFIIEKAKDVYYGYEPKENVGVTAVDKHTLVFTLTESVADFPELTAGVRFMPCNEEFFTGTGGKYGLTQRTVITNGAFKFDGSYAWSEDGLNLVIDSDYCGKLAVKPQKLNLRTGFNLEDYTEEEAYIAVAKGDLDMVEISPEDAENAKAAGCQVLSYTDSVTGILINSSVSALEIESIRRLFTDSINKTDFITQLPAGTTAASQIIPPGLRVGKIDYRSVVSTGMADLSGQGISGEISDILKEAGLSRVPSITILCRDDPMSTGVANGLISSWGKELGSYCNIEPLDESSYSSKIYNRDYEMALCSISSEDGTVYSLLSNFESGAYPRLLDSDAFDTILHRESSVANYMEVERFLNNQYIFYPIFWQETYYAVNPQSTGIIIDHGRPDFISADKK